MEEFDPVLKSALRLGESGKKLHETKDPIWIGFLQREISILLRRVFVLWFKLWFRASLFITTGKVKHDGDQ